MTTDITELALIAKIKKQTENFDTVVLKEWEALALVEALEKAQQRIASQREYYEGVIADGGKRIAELESRTVKLPDEVDVLLNHLEEVLPSEAFQLIDVHKWNAVSRLSATGIKVEAE
ncbi:hypothetical protein ACV95M_020455 [Klebsiella variicola]|uniref:hypothetical protein n=1 Tax=Klebsiella variicola TaxID=244366 RepID=UPI003CC54F17